MNAARAILLALLLGWVLAGLARLGRCRGAAADRARGRPDRHAVSSGDIATLTQTLAEFRGAEGQPDRGADRADHGWRGDRAILAPGCRSLEDRPQEDRRRCAARRRQERPPSAHRGRLRPRGRADRRHLQAHHRRGHHAEIQDRRFRRRYFRRRRPDDPGDRRREVAGAGAAALAGSEPAQLHRSGSMPVRPVWLFVSAACCAACSAACSARSATGGVVGVLAWFICRIACGALLLAIVMVFTIVVPRSWPAADRVGRASRPSGWGGSSSSGGGSWSSGSSSSSDSGGFSGGGGSFGGGGASGSW